MRPDLLARYQEQANQKIPQIADSVRARQRSTPTRQRLEVLGQRFEDLIREVGDSPQLTPAQRARAMEILREAQPLARSDFDNFRNSLNGALRRDQQLRGLEQALRSAGDVSDAPNGGLRVRTRNDATQAITYEPLNVEHRVRLSDNPWLYNHRNNLILTDAPQNQQFLESLRKYGKIWPTDPVEGFVISHGLHDQPIDFRPGAR